jgi:hypothetical protein
MQRAIVHTWVFGVCDFVRHWCENEVRGNSDATGASVQQCRRGIKNILGMPVFSEECTFPVTHRLDDGGSTDL